MISPYSSRPPIAVHQLGRGAAWLLLAWAATLLSGSAVSGRQPIPPPKKPADVPEMRLRWMVEPRRPVDPALVSFDLAGKVLLLLNRNSIEAQSFNALTGKEGPELPVAAGSRSSNFHAMPLQRSRFAFQPGNSREKELVLWEALSGKTSRIPIPQVFNGIPSLELSIDGRYIACGGRVGAKNKSPESPFRVIDGKTSKTVLSMDWENGSAYFTETASRVLVHDAVNRFRWFKLPSGQIDGEWRLGPEQPGFPAKVLDLSADGDTLLFRGQPPKKPFGIHVLNGKNGEVLHSFPAGRYLDDRGNLSRDGKSVVLVRFNGAEGPSAELLDTKGTLLARVALPSRSRFSIAPPVNVCWETRSLATYDAEKNKLLVYDLPGAAVSIASRRDSNAKAREFVPGDAAIAKGEMVVREVLKTEYARKQPAEKRALVEKLIRLAAETGDDLAARYVMLRDARDIAIDLNDPLLAVQAINELAKEYELDGPVQTLEALEKIIASSPNATALKGVADSAGPAADDLSAADSFDEAVQFAQLAVNAARKGRLGPVATEEADYRLTWAKKARDLFAAIRPAVDKLRTDPNDPEANSIVGKYRCFVQGRWDDGLKHLALSTSAALREVAELDLKTPRTGTPEVNIADAWWDYAQTAPADERWGVLTRTRYWYSRCIPGLTGLNKVKAESRLVFTFTGVEYRPGLVCELSAKRPAVLNGKKARIDPIIDFSGGEFADGGKQTDLTIKWTGVLIPPIGGRYELGVNTSDPVQVRIDNRVVIDTRTPKASKKEGNVILGERPALITVEFSAPNTDRHKLKLTWRSPASPSEDVIPAECLFHDKKAAAALGK